MINQLSSQPSLSRSQSLAAQRKSLPGSRLFTALLDDPLYSELTATDILLYTVLFSRTLASLASASEGDLRYIDDRGPFCIFTTEEASKKVHASTRTVSRSLKVLKKLGLLAVVRTPRASKLYIQPLAQSGAENRVVEPSANLANHKTNLDPEFMGFSSEKTAENRVVEPSANLADYLLFTKDLPTSDTNDTTDRYISRAREEREVDDQKKLNLSSALRESGLPQQAVQELYTKAPSYKAMYDTVGELWKAKSAVEKAFDVELILEDLPGLAGGLAEVFRRVLTAVQTSKVSNLNGYVYTSFKKYFEREVARLSKYGLLAPKRTTEQAQGTGKKVPLAKISDTAKL